MFRKIRRQAASYAVIPLERLDDATVHAHLTRFAGEFLHPRMLRRLHEIVSAQSRAYMILERLLSAWIPSNADRLLTHLMTGLGTLPNARLTYRLMALSAVARSEPRVESFLSRAPSLERSDDTERRSPVPGSWPSSIDCCRSSAIGARSSPT